MHQRFEGIPAREHHLVTAALIVALLTMLVAGAVAHGALRPLLEGRGVRPWRLRDTLASIPLILLGSAGVGGGCTVLALNAGNLLHVSPPSTLVLSCVAAIVLSSALMLWLGLIALRKLS